MTPQTESRIRSLAANVADLDQRIALLRKELEGATTLESRQQISGDLAVACRVHYEANAELIDLKSSFREV